MCIDYHKVVYVYRPQYRAGAAGWAGWAMAHPTLRPAVGRVGHGPPNSQARFFFLPLYRDIEHQERSVDRHSHPYSCSGPSLIPRRLGTRLIIVPRHPYHVVPACPLKYGERAFSPWPKLRVSEEEIWYKRKVLPITVVR